MQWKMHKKHFSDASKAFARITMKLLDRENLSVLVCPTNKAEVVLSVLIPLSEQLLSIIQAEVGSNPLQ